MTAAQTKLVVAGGLALLAWWLSSRARKVGRVSSEIEINADVYSPGFGDPIDLEAEARHQHLVDLVDESNQAIAAYDATHPPLPY
jgi:hypothetical protein